MATLEENIAQAISDFDDIAAAIEEQGVDVPAGTDTKEYGDKIRSIQGGNVKVDLIYDPESTNAQSGLAVAEALASQPIKYVESLDSENYLNLYDLESGMYVLNGRFLVYPNATKRFVFNRNLFVAVSHGSTSTCVQVIYPPYNTIQYLNIYPPDEEAGTGYTYERKDAELYYMEDTRQKVTELNESADDEHYPSAKAVYDKVKDTSNSLVGVESGEVIRVDDVSPVEHTVKAKVKSKNLFDTSPIQTQSANETYAYISGVSEGCIEVTTAEGYTGNGHCQTHTMIKNLCPQIEAGKTYVISAETDSTIKMIHLRETDTFVYFDTPVVFTKEMIESTVGVYGLDARYDNTVVGTCKISNIQLEEGDTATEYAPYVDPSTVTVTRCGKNLLKNTAKSQTLNGITLTTNEDGSITVNGTVEKTSFFAVGKIQPTVGATHLLSGCPSGGGFDTYILYIHNNTTGADIYDTGQGKAFTGQEGDQNVVIAMYEGATANNLKFYPMIVSGENSGGFEAYKEPATYTPEADGTVNGITSLAPTMTLLTDKAGVIIEAEYHQDINAAFDEVNAILEALLNGGA